MNNIDCLPICHRKNKNILSSEPVCATRYSVTMLDTALAEFYVQNPHLAPDPNDNNQEENFGGSSFFEKIEQYKKPFLYNLAHYGPFIFFSSKLYKNYRATYVIQKDIEHSVFTKSLNSLCPAVLLNMPKHTQFFLEATELLVQTYLLKILLKMIVFCLV